MTHQKTLTILFAFALAACSSSSGDSTSTTDTGTVKDTGTSGGDTGTPPSDTGTSPTDTGTAKDGASADTGGGGDDTTCAAATSQADCQKCCRTNHDAAYTAFADTLVKCACDAATAGTCGGTSGACAATVCAATPKSPDTACNTCLGDIQSAGCKTALTTACTGSGPCAPFEGCITAQCAGKK